MLGRSPGVAGGLVNIAGVLVHKAVNGFAARVTTKNAEEPAAFGEADRDFQCGGAGETPLDHGCYNLGLKVCAECGDLVVGDWLRCHWCNIIGDW